MNLKNQLQLYLEENDMTMAQLARKAGIAKQTLHNWSTSQKPGDIRQVKKVAEVLGTSIDSLLFGEGIEVIEKVNPLDALMDGEYFSGVFEVKVRRIKK